jgi:hypothetical protein
VNLKEGTKAGCGDEFIANPAVLLWSAQSTEACSSATYTGSPTELALQGRLLSVFRLPSNTQLLVDVHVCTVTLYL